MKTQSFRSKVFAWAHEIARATGRHFAVCLSQAWSIYRLRRAMLKGTVRFCFEKADGRLRAAVGTLKDVGDKVKGTGAFNPKTVTFFDIEKGEFRSFKTEKFFTILGGAV